MEVNLVKQQLAELFAEWKAKYVSAFAHIDYVPFTYDGVMQHGKTEEESLQDWFASPRRVAFILKEQNESDNPIERGGSDTRTWGKITRLFGSNLRRMFLCLIYNDSQTDIPYNGVYDATNNQWAENVFHNTPVALLEAKKISGGSQSNEAEICQYIVNDKEYLKRELDILKPNIVVVCGNAEFQAILDNQYEGAVKIADGLYRHDASHCVIIQAYHPSYRRCGVVYERVYAAWKTFHSMKNEEWAKNYAELFDYKYDGDKGFVKVN
ncbi:MAG: hypothetical protein HUK07_09375 [Bacteroidaceae bacterium]|nr:hypothetical protein [Bacteroidaceae bacterium]